MQYDFEDNMRSPNEYRRERSTKRQNESAKRNSGDAFFGVVMTQIIVFALIGGVLFGFYKSKSDTFSQLKTVYNTIMQKDYSIKQITDAVKTAVYFIAKPQPKESPTQSGEITTQSAELTTQQIENSTQAMTQLSDDEGEIYGAGGEDLLYATENTNFSPFFLSVPITVPVEYTKISSPFGYRINPITNEYGFHTGIDLAAPMGTDIKSAFDGTVVDVKTTSGKGKQIIVETNGNIKTTYCHCSEIIAEVGAKVNAGEVIAKVGSTGQSTGPHIHFEIIINGIYYNPMWAIDS